MERITLQLFISVLLFKNYVLISLTGACEGTLACSTCHLILPEDVYAKLPPPVDEELDMLDLAYELTDT